ncbi:MAG: hypothetical protein KDI06_22090 [Calditrichaeota bacterium]|nr:hypothetical protein [Calditrichota bacterium]
MQVPLNAFVSALKNLLKAYQALLKSSPDKEQARQAVDEQLERVTGILQDPVFAPWLDRQLEQIAGEKPGGPSFPPGFVRQEKTLLNRAGFDSNLMDRLVMLADLPEGRKIASCADLREALENTHAKFIRAFDNSLNLPRKPKKHLRKNIRRGIASGISGIALIGLNVLLPELAVYSINSGIGAILLALRDLAGD